MAGTVFVFHHPSSGTMIVSKRTKPLFHPIINMSVKILIMLNIHVLVGPPSHIQCHNHPSVNRMTHLPPTFRAW